MGKRKAIPPHVQWWMPLTGGGQVTAVCVNGAPHPDGLPWKMRREYKYEVKMWHKELKQMARSSRN